MHINAHVKKKMDDVKKKIVFGSGVIFSGKIDHGCDQTQQDAYKTDNRSINKSRFQN